MIHLFLCASDIEDDYARAVSHNLFDFVVEHSISSKLEYGIDQITVGSSMDQLLEVARQSPSEWGVFYKVGTIFKYMHLHTVRKHIQEAADVVGLIGHILDRDERYYELHDQSFVVNLARLKELPPHVRYTSTAGIKNLLDRSDENFHHGYTPKGVAANGQQAHVEHPAPGADLISSMVELGPIRPYNDEERRYKGYVYPESSQSFQDTVGRLEKEIAGIKSNYFMFNTDVDVIPRFVHMDKISRMVIPMSGFLPFELLRNMNPEDDFKFVFYDTSETAKWMYHYICDEWDGLDIDVLINRLPGSSISGPGTYEARMQEFDGMMDRFGGKSEWLSFFNYYRHRRYMRTIDVFSDYDRPDFVSLYEDHQDTTLYSISNIYWYAPAAIFRSCDTRVRLFNRHMAYLEQHTPDVNVYYAMPDQEYGGAVKNRPQYTGLTFPWRTGANLVDKTVDLL